MRSAYTCSQRDLFRPRRVADLFSTRLIANSCSYADRIPPKIRRHVYRKRDGNPALVDVNGTLRKNEFTVMPARIARRAKAQTRSAQPDGSRNCILAVRVVRINMQTFWNIYHNRATGRGTPRNASVPDRAAYCLSVCISRSQEE